MTSYRFGGHSYSPEHEGWQRVLQKAYGAKLRPVCECRLEEEAPEFYISLQNGQYVLKRLPLSGSAHAAACEHYEPPPELSGQGQVTGSAIREEPDSQTTTLVLDFALSKGRSRQASASGDIEHESVRSDGTKLTMRGLLHYLLDEAGLTRWLPAMQGRRTWFVVRREILQAAMDKTTKGRPLLDVLFVPEPFHADRLEQIRRHQQEALAPLAASTSARMVLLGELKAIEEARYGRCIVVKHMPEVRFMVSDDLHKRLLSRFSDELHLWAQLEASHLLILAVVSRSAQGVHVIEALCMANVNAQWIPFESLFEWQLLESLHQAQRRFSKGLRYNLPSVKPLACAVLQDTPARPTALFVVPQGLEAAYDMLIVDVEDAAVMSAWRWNVGTESMGDLPSAVLVRMKA